MPTKNQKPKKKLFCLLLFEGTFTSAFKDKKYKRKLQNSKTVHQVEKSYINPMATDAKFYYRSARRIGLDENSMLGLLPVFRTPAPT
jgi:hypothetical protein